MKFSSLFIGSSLRPFAFFLIRPCSAFLACWLSALFFLSFSFFTLKLLTLKQSCSALLDCGKETWFLVTCFIAEKLFHNLLRVTGFQWFIFAWLSFLSLRNILCCFGRKILDPLIAIWIHIGFYVIQDTLHKYTLIRTMHIFDVIIKFMKDRHFYPAFLANITLRWLFLRMDWILVWWYNPFHRKFHTWKQKVKCVWRMKATWCCWLSALTISMRCSSRSTPKQSKQLIVSSNILTTVTYGFNLFHLLFHHLFIMIQNSMMLLDAFTAKRRCKQQQKMPSKCQFYWHFVEWNVKIKYISSSRLSLYRFIFVFNVSAPKQLQYRITGTW